MIDDATHRTKRVAVQGTEGLVALDPYMALGDEHLGVGIRRERLDDVVCDGDDPFDDHFPTVHGVPGRGSVKTYVQYVHETGTSAVPERDDVTLCDGPARMNTEAVKDDDVVPLGRVWIECRLADGNE